MLSYVVDADDVRIGELRHRLRLTHELRKQHTWGDITDEQYRLERQRLQRELDEILRDQTAPFAVTDYSRAGKMLSEFGTLWSHPGVSDASRKAFIEEVFEQVQIDELGIRAVKPAEAYLPLMAIARVGEYCAGESGLPLQTYLPIICSFVIGRGAVRVEPDHGRQHAVVAPSCSSQSTVRRGSLLMLPSAGRTS